MSGDLTTRFANEINVLGNLKLNQFLGTTFLLVLENVILLQRILLQKI